METRNHLKTGRYRKALRVGNKLINMKMKKTLLSFFIAGCLILSYTSASAQGKCKFTINKTDPLTGKLHKATNVLIKSMGMFSAVIAWGIDFDRMGDDYSIISRLVLNSNSEEYLQQGDSLLIKLESGKILTLYAKSKIAPKALNKPNESPLTNYVSTYPIPMEDFKLLSSDKIIYFRINVGPLVFDQEMNEKAIPKLQNAAICVLQ